jgi:hypothetical protein
MRAKALLLAVASTIALAACGGAALAPTYAPGEAGFPAPEVVVEELDASRAAGEPFAAAPPAAVERLVIQTASLSLVVEDPAQSLAEIRAMAEGMGGFVVTSNLYQTSYGDPAVVTHTGSVTIRVPSERFTEALERLKGDAVEVRSENISGEDVTQQYTDLQSRLRNLEATEEQLREIMDTAVRTEDVLRVLQDLRQVREEIEVIKGQIQYYEESARLSAISLELIPDEAAQPIQIGGWRPEGTVKVAFETLIRALQRLADLAIWAVICGVPALLIAGLPTWAAVRIARRRRAAAPAKASPEQKN